ncbi:MAG: hypothetical protein PHH37_11000 [Paludibacter sp.]|nr:hypothetical protein [Paludibacter sp.]
MKKTITIFLLFLSLGLAAQQNRVPDVDDMHARKWQYMVDHAHLTAQEAVKIEPIFMNYEKAQWKLLEQNKEFFRKFRDDRKARKNPNYEGMNDRYVNMEIQKAQLLKDYYFKLKKYLGSEKIFDYFNAERSFRKELIRDWRGRKNQETSPM